MKKKILLIFIIILAFFGANAWAGGSSAPAISAVTLSKHFGISSGANTVIIHFCNADKNVVSKKIKVKIQTNAIKTGDISPNKKQSQTSAYNPKVKIDSNGCGNATIKVKNGKFNVKVRMKEQEVAGKFKWWTSWSGEWITQ